MNGKQAKKLRWYARVTESMMPDPVVNEKGVSSLLLVYEYPRTAKRRDGSFQQVVRRTIQYNPRTSGKGFYKALKGKRARVRGTVPFVRYMCQQRIIQMLTAKREGAARAAAEVETHGTRESLASALRRPAHTGNAV